MALMDWVEMEAQVAKVESAEKRAKGMIVGCRFLKKVTRAILERVTMKYTERKVQTVLMDHALRQFLHL